MNADPLQFHRLNKNWNAHANIADNWIEVEGRDLLFRFRLGEGLVPRFQWPDIGVLRFANCSRYRLGSINDEGWYSGQCRYSKLAPAWGEFYELTGNDPLRDLPDDWVAAGGNLDVPRHFLFYLRDETFECMAADWCIDRAPDNPLLRAIGSKATARTFSLKGIWHRRR